MTLLLLLVGLGLVVLGADWLVDGASSIARRAGMSQFVIGLTIVGFGTSCPELVVSLTGAIEGNADICVGNVTGSNIFNTLFILGLTSLLMPVAMTEENRRRDIPIALLATAFMLMLGLGDRFLGLSAEGNLSRLDGILLLLLFAAYIVYSFRSDEVPEISSEKEDNRLQLWKAIMLVILGLCGLIFGGDMFVDNATALARQIGVSDKFVAVTILAGGTSLPELATSIVAAAKKKDQLALGNILGSNVFNALLILGASAIITPLSFSSITIADAAVLLTSALLPLICAYSGTRCRIDRWEGVVMLTCFAAYYIFLFINL